MRAITSNAIRAGRLVTAFASSDPATTPPGDIVLDHGAASAGNRRLERRQNIEAALARMEHAIVGVMQALRDGLTRRQAVRELRLLGRSRLADIGIEPDAIEQTVDAMIAARRRGAAIGGGSPRPHSG